MPVHDVTIFGILNVTRDSFSDGGRFVDPAAAIEHAALLAAGGADVIDVGAASSHPDAEAVPAALEIERLAAVVPALLARGLAVSVDTWQPDVQRWAARAGAQWINDIRGFPDAAARSDLAATGVGLVAMHSIRGEGRATREERDAAGTWDAVTAFFDARLAEFDASGIDRGRVVLDPGLGYFLGDRAAPSLAMLARVGDLARRYGLPVLVSASRKSFVGEITGRPVDERGAGSLAAELFAVERGARFVRTHDPAALADALRMGAALGA